jgi:hypothetical protein
MPIRGRALLPENFSGPHPHLPFLGDEPAGGAGTQETTEETTEQNTESDTGPTGATGSTDDDWKGRARTWESRAKKDALELTKIKRELEQVRQSNMSEGEKAVEKARVEGQQQGRSEAAGLLVQARLEAALAHVDDEARDALIEGVNAARFLREDGTPDTESIKTWASKVAPKSPQVPDLGQGRRHASKPTDMNSIIRRAAGL